MSNSLSLAYAIQKKNKKASGGMMKCAHGGPIHCEEGCYAKGGPVPEKNMMKKPSSISQSILMKKMAKGGMVEDEDVEENLLDYEDPMDEESDLEMPDSDDSDDDMKKKGILQKILSRRK